MNRTAVSDDLDGRRPTISTMDSSRQALACGSRAERPIGNGFQWCRVDGRTVRGNRFLVFTSTCPEKCVTACRGGNTVVSPERAGNYLPENNEPCGRSRRCSRSPRRPSDEPAEQPPRRGRRHDLRDLPLVTAAGPGRINGTDSPPSRWFGQGRGRSRSPVAARRQAELPPLEPVATRRRVLACGARAVTFVAKGWVRVLKLPPHESFRRSGPRRPAS